MTTRLRVGIPPEIWDHIFEIATHVPYTLVPEIFEKSTLIGDDYNELCRPALKTAFATKRSLVLVCKQWWHLAIRYLYRAILIDNPRKILSICSTLQNYANGMGAVPGAKPLGWWAERLDVVIRGADADEEPLVDVIMCLPNLAVVSLDIGERRSKDESILHHILNALRHAASSLRVLDWSMESSHPATLLIERRLVAELSRLCILRSRYMPWTDGFIPQNVLSSLTKFAVKRMLIMEGGIPGGSGLEGRQISLREVVIDMTYDDFGSWSIFMGRYGIFLTSVHLTHCDNYQNRFSFYLTMIKQSCPNIRRLTLSVINFSCLTHMLSLPPIEYLGLSTSGVYHYWMGTEALFSALATLRDTLPTLRVVQFTNPDNVARPRTCYRMAVRALETDLAQCTFRIGDHDGNLLLEMLEAVGEPLYCLKYLFQFADPFD
ncbi:hypothetical protein EDD16DRAFT_1718816 [Pisolithus croceorrhizus]|nr:hypothetical protein EDD16DRAFT_1718816 [Pisolithus croceorrhizus]